MSIFFELVVNKREYQSENVNCPIDILERKNSKK